MRLAIRDDDTNYYTRPAELEEVYAPLGASVPVSLAVTPFAVESFYLGDPVRFFQSGAPQPLSGNPELAAYLRKGIGTGRWSVMCHGYTHAYVRNSARELIQECVWKDDHRLGKEAALGRQHLEEVLGCQVRAFVPPGNTIRLSAMRAVGKTFPHLLATVPARRWREFLRFPTAGGMLARRLAYEFFHNLPCPRAERFGGAWLLPSLSLTQNCRWENLITRFAMCRRLGADLIVAVHYWELQGTVRELFYRFLDYAAQNGATFAHCDELFPD
ncbi:MAG TPA: DUF2334 domain-containing protein [Bryobacteraceae bacterium]|nr:DUF2334 domain-containing protein [Bryobacteraceae bacterium]